MSLDINMLVAAVKQAAVEAVQAGKPCAVTFGKVQRAAPLQILVDQKLLLTSAQLILTNNVQDYTVQMTLEESTEASEEKSYLVHNGLKAGEQVILLRADGGQRYIVLDKIRR